MEDASLDPERLLALQYAREPARSALRALWSFDAALGRVVATTREPMIGAIRLAWWNDRLEDLGRGFHPPEPVLQALAKIVPSAFAPAELAPLVDGWSAALPPWPIDASAMKEYAGLRGQNWLTASARLLDAPVPPALFNRAEAWALFDLAATVREGPAREQAVGAARERRVGLARQRWPVRLRPAGMIVELAISDASTRGMQRRGAPGRIARMAWHAATGW